MNEDFQEKLDEIADQAAKDAIENYTLGHPAPFKKAMLAILDVYAGREPSKSALECIDYEGDLFGIRRANAFRAMQAAQLKDVKENCNG